MNEETFIFYWEVKNFSLIPQEFGHSFTSNKFITPFLKNTKWTALICTRPYDEPQFLHFVLVKSDNSATTEFNVTFQLFSNNGLPRQKIFPIICMDGHLFRFLKFVNRTELEHSCLCKDTLKMQCTFKKVTKEMITRTMVDCTYGYVKKIYAKWPLTNFVRVNRGIVLKTSIKPLFDVCLSIEGRAGQRVVTINFTRRCGLTKKPLSLNVLITVLNAEGVDTEIYKQDQHVFCLPDEVWQFPTFISKTLIVKQKHKYLLNDVFTLKCEIAIALCSKASKLKGSSYVKTDAKVIGALREDMKDLYTSKRLADVKIRASGITLAAHRIILHSRSKGFAKMLDEIEGTNNMFLDVPDVDIITLERMLKYMYTDEIEHLEHDDAVKLSLASCKYGIESLECKFSDDTINVFTDSSRNIRIYYPRI